MTLIGFVGEDENHFRVVTSLVDDVLVARIEWVRDILESCREWRGLRQGERWYKYSPDDADDLRPVTFDGVTIKPHGRIAGEPLKPEASMWRNVLMLFLRAEPRPDIVVLARDLDGYPDRSAGIDQVRNGLSWPFQIVAATPEPEIEGWMVCGFVPQDDDERARLEQMRRELSFDPTLQSHRLTSHPNHAPTDAKRVLSRLCHDRERPPKPWRSPSPRSAREGLAYTSNSMRSGASSRSLTATRNDTASRPSTTRWS
jgi:hypothetical protein